MATLNPFSLRVGQLTDRWPLDQPEKVFSPVSPGIACPAVPTPFAPFICLIESHCVLCVGVNELNLKSTAWHICRMSMQPQTGWPAAWIAGPPRWPGLPTVRWQLSNLTNDWSSGSRRFVLPNCLAWVGNSWPCFHYVLIAHKLNSCPKLKLIPLFFTLFYYRGLQIVM